MREGRGRGGGKGGRRGGRRVRGVEARVKKGGCERGGGW